MSNVFALVLLTVPTKKRIYRNLTIENLVPKTTDTLILSELEARTKSVTFLVCALAAGLFIDAQVKVISEKKNRVRRRVLFTVHVLFFQVFAARKHFNQVTLSQHLNTDLFLGYCFCYLIRIFI